MVFAAADTSYAADGDKKANKIDITVTAPVIGNDPKTEAKADITWDKANPTTDNDTKVKWFDGDSGSTTEQSGSFKVDKSYTVRWTKAFGAEDPVDGFVDGAQTVVNGKSTKHRNYDPSTSTYDVAYTWTLHEVKFHSNDGTDKIESQTVYQGEQTSLDKNKFTFANHSFKEWNTEANGTGSIYSEGDAVTLDGSIELYAQWEITITFNPNNGTGTMNPKKAISGSTVELPANEFTRDGYRFKGWNTDPEGKGKDYKNKEASTFDSDITLYAQWEAVPAPTPVVTHRVTFNANGGTGSMNAMVEEEGTSKALDANKFKRDGYTFTGWNIAKNGSGKSYADRATWKFDADAILYAQWEADPVQYSIAFRANGGKGSMDSISGDEGSTVTLSANKFTRSGYTFNGWNTEKNGSGDSYDDKEKVKLDSNMTLYAQWKANSQPVTTCKLTFHANGGTGTMDSVGARKGSTLTLPENKFKREGYTFKGWNTAKDGSGTAYADKASVKVNADVTLYAQWEKNGTKANASTVARTGDNLPGVLFAILPTVAVAALIVLVLAKRRID